MLSVIIFAVCVGLSSQQGMPHGHELAQIVDSGFKWLDKNHDGILSLDELNAAEAKEDTNNDGMISLAEYMAFTNLTEAVAKPMFDAYDVDGDGLLPTNHMLYYLHIMDRNGDGLVNMHEYEQFNVHLIQCVYGEHGHGTATHGHAATCF